MEGIIIEKITTQLLHLLITNPDLQKSLLDHGTMVIQQLGLPIPLHVTEVFLSGLKQLSDTQWVAEWRISVPQSYCCPQQTCGL